MQRFDSLRPYMESLKKLLALAPTILYPGHGPVVMDAVGVIRQYIRHREKREAQVRERERDTGEGETQCEGEGE